MEAIGPYTKGKDRYIAKYHVFCGFHLSTCYP
jgi:hypothetical protein